MSECRRVTTPCPSSGLSLLPPIQLLGHANGPPSSATRSLRGGLTTNSISSRLGTPSASTELLASVEKNRAALRVFHETTNAVRYVSTENAMMEDILSDKHRMLTNADLAIIMSSVMLRADGSQVSSIISSRKPPELKLKHRVLSGLLPVTSNTGAQRSSEADIRMGPVNYRALLEQQQEAFEKSAESRVAYESMISDFFKKQQSLSDRFANII